MEEEGSSVVRCLQDYITEIKDDKCKEQVGDVQQWAFLDSWVEG